MERKCTWLATTGTVQSGQQALHRIYRPNNTIQAQWLQNFTTYYSASYTSYSYTLPAPAVTGVWRYEITYNGQAPLNTYFGVNTIAYAFTKTGNWDVASNWSNNTRPPAVLPAGSEILVNPTVECVLNVPQTISAGAKISVAAGKSFRVLGNLSIQ